MTLRSEGATSPMRMAGRTLVGALIAAAAGSGPAMAQQPGCETEAAKARIATSLWRGAQSANDVNLGDLDACKAQLAASAGEQELVSEKLPGWLCMNIVKGPEFEAFRIAAVVNTMPRYDMGSYSLILPLSESTRFFGPGREDAFNMLAFTAPPAEMADLLDAVHRIGTEGADGEPPRLRLEVGFQRAQP